MQELRPSQARELLEGTEPVQLLDVREVWEHELARLAAARLIPLVELPGRLGELDPDRPVLVYCHHGIRSRMAAGFLEQNAFPRVFNLAGGIDAWSLEIDPSVPTY
jgi:rhodanese-related sulfurtransferase